jgi:predicted acetyltransferase
VTRPESRGLGHMNALMSRAFEHMRDNAQDFSFIFPFSFAYYRKFGYEMCYFYDKVKIPVSQFRDYKLEVNAAPHEPNDSFAPFDEIYKHFTREKNFSIIRNEKLWEEILDRDPYLDLQFTYLFRDKTGDAVAYILYEVERDDDDGNRLIITELCWKTPDALQIVFSFLARLGAEFEYVLWNAPSCLEILALFPEGYAIEFRRESAGMNRIVDVAAALSTLRAPEKNGRIIISVADKFLPQNTGVYAVDFENGSLSATRAQLAPDIDLSIETLSQLVAGYITPQAAAYKKDVTVRGNIAELNALFPKRNPFINNRY